MTSLSTLLTIGSITLSALMLTLWLGQRRHEDAGIVDVGWAFGIGVLCVLYWIGVHGNLLRRSLAGFLGCIWAFRLSYYLLNDRIIGKEEDGRYHYLRKHWGDRAQRNFFVFFQFQALLSLLFSLPMLAVAIDTRTTLSLSDFIGMGIWLTALVGESIADRQLSHFRAKATNRGRTCRSGLWRYSRHPNYFFEWLHWWAYVFLTYGQAYWIYTLIAPLLMLYSLLKISGIPYTEAQALRTRGKDYERYQAETNCFFPWFPREAIQSNEV